MLFKKSKTAMAGECRERTTSCAGSWEPGDKIAFKHRTGQEKGVPVCMECAITRVQAGEATWDGQKKEPSAIEDSLRLPATPHGDETAVSITAETDSANELRKMAFALEEFMGPHFDKEIERIFGVFIEPYVKKFEELEKLAEAYKEPVQIETLGMQRRLEAVEKRAEQAETTAGRSIVACKGNTEQINYLRQYVEFYMSSDEVTA